MLLRLNLADAHSQQQGSSDNASQPLSNTQQSSKSTTDNGHEALSWSPTSDRGDGPLHADESNSSKRGPCVDLKKDMQTLYTACYRTVPVSGICAMIFQATTSDERPCLRAVVCTPTLAHDVDQAVTNKIETDWLLTDDDTVVLQINGLGERVSEGDVVRRMGVEVGATW